MCEGGSLAPNVALGRPSVGVTPSYTPVHHVLLHDVGRPLVTTSGNASDEPIAFEDDDAPERLSGIADLSVAQWPDSREVRRQCAAHGVGHAINRASRARLRAGRDRARTKERRRRSSG